MAPSSFGKTEKAWIQSNTQRQQITHFFMYFYYLYLQQNQLSILSETLFWRCMLHVMDFFWSDCVCCSMWAIIHVRIKNSAQGLHNQTAASTHVTRGRERIRWGKRFWDKTSQFFPFQAFCPSVVLLTLYLTCHLPCTVQNKTMSEV